MSADLKYTPLDAHDVARIVCRRRPLWDEPGVIAALGRAAHELTIDQALAALLSAAADPEAHAPSAMSWSRHRMRSTAAVAPAAVAGVRRCPDHGPYRTEQCTPCRSEVLAGQRPAGSIGAHWDPEEKP